MCPHWGVLTVGVTARCSIEVVSKASGIFPLNYRTKCLLWHVHVHFDCAGSHKTMSPEVSPVVFPLNFHTKWLLYFVQVHFDCAGTHRTMSPEVSPVVFPEHFHSKAAVLRPCAFRLRRLAQNDIPGGVRGHFSCKLPYKINGSCAMSVCISTAQKKVSPEVSAAIFPVIFHTKFEMALLQCPSAFRLRRLAQIVLPGLGISLPP